MIYKENYAMDGTTILHFRESVVRSLLLGESTANFKPGPRQQLTGRLKRKIADH